MTVLHLNDLMHHFSPTQNVSMSLPFISLFSNNVFSFTYSTYLKVFILKFWINSSSLFSDFISEEINSMREKMTLPSVQNKTVSASEKNLSKVISVFGFEHAWDKEIMENWAFRF